MGSSVPQAAGTEHVQPSAEESTPGLHRLSRPFLRLLYGSTATLKRTSAWPSALRVKSCTPGFVGSRANSTHAGADNAGNVVSRPPSVRDEDTGWGTTRWAPIDLTI